jgi:hypothetical protein
LVDDDSETRGADEQPLEASVYVDPDAVAGAGPLPFTGTSAEPAEQTWDGHLTHLRVLGESSPDAAICPFLRATTDGGLGPPIEMPDPANRCTAVGEPTPQSGRQQELVCLTRGHSNCPRYLRGALVVGEPTAAPVVRSGPSLAIVGAALVLAIAASMSIGFLLVRGGFDLSLASPLPSQLAVAVATPGPTTFSLRPTPTPTLTPSPSLPPPSPSPSLPPPSPSPAITPTPTPNPTPKPTPRPTPRPTTAPVSNRYQFLTKCPSTPNCWIYTVRRGDNLRSIVNWFGVSYNTVLRMNPWIHDPTQIRAGDKIRIPKPTR